MCGWGTRSSLRPHQTVLRCWQQTATDRERHLAKKRHAREHHPDNSGKQNWRHRDNGAASTAVVKYGPSAVAIPRAPRFAAAQGCRCALRYARGREHRQQADHPRQRNVHSFGAHSRCPSQKQRPGNSARSNHIDANRFRPGWVAALTAAPGCALRAGAAAKPCRQYGVHVRCSHA